MNKNNLFSKNVTLSAKGIAIILMLFHHLFYDAPGFVDRYGVSSSPLSWQTLNALSYYAKICVSIFVFLTGYGMTLNLMKRDTKERERYSVSRFLKLESGFIFVYLLTILSGLILKPELLKNYFAEGHLKGIFLMFLDGIGLAKFFDTVTFNNTWWYMSFAIFLIFLMPVAVKLYEHFGICAVALAAMVSMFGIDSSRAFSLYLPSLFFGIGLAGGDVIEKIRSECTTLSKKILYLFICFAGFILFSTIRIRWGFYPWTNAFVSAFLVLTIFVLSDLLCIRLRLMELFGKYSMTIFLTHTLIYHHYFTDFIYTPKNWFFITILLSAVSLAAAFVIELLRKLTRWDRIKLWHLC